MSPYEHTTLSQLRRLVGAGCPSHVTVTADRIIGDGDPCWGVFLDNRRTGAVGRVIPDRGDYGGGLPGYYRTRQRAVDAAAEAQRERGAVTLMAQRVGRAKCDPVTGRSLIPE